MHLGELAGATETTEDTKELLARSFCEALWLLTWQSTHNSEPPRRAGQGLRRGGQRPREDEAVTWVALRVWGEAESAGTWPPVSVQSCAGAWASPFGLSEPPFSWTAGWIHSRPYSHAQRDRPKPARLSRWNLSLICMLEQSKDDQWRWFAKLPLKPKKKGFFFFKFPIISLDPL